MQTLDTLPTVISPSEGLTRIFRGLDGLVESFGDDSNINAQETSESPLDASFAVLTPASDLVSGGLNQFTVIFGRQGNDTLYPFDQSVSATQTPVNIDIFFGDSEPAGPLVLIDVLNTIVGNPPAGGNDRFVLGDWRKSFYTNNGYNDFGFLLNFNKNEDVIQLNGSPEDYDFVNVPFLGTAILQKSEGSQSVFDGDLVGITFFAFDLDPNGANFQYVGDTPPPGPVEPRIEQLGTVGLELATDTTTDIFGNVYVTGFTNGSFLGETNNGSNDVWIAKYNSDGEQLFIQQIGSSQSELSFAIETDNFGNFYVVGGTQGDLVAPTQTEGEDAFIAKYDANGTELWIEQFRFNDGFITSATDIEIDDNGDVYISGLVVAEDGIIQGGVDPQGDFFAAKYDTNGSQQWITRVGSETVDSGNLPPWEEAYGVALSSDGSVYTTGWTLGDLPDNTNAGFYDSWITKFNNDGQVEWIRQFGTPSDEFGWNVDTDSQGNVYAYGWTKGNFGGEIAGFSDLFLTKYSPEGDQLWVRQFGSEGDDAAFIGGLTIDANDSIYVTGFTDNNLGGTNAGSYDAFVASFDTEGNQVWTQQFGTPQLEYGTNINVDNFGNLYVSGFTEGSFGDVNAGSVDGWVAKLDASSGSLLNFDTQVSSPPNKISGTNGSDRLIGTDCNDVIDGLNGNDYTFGGKGDDKLVGAAGDDVMVGGDGMDSLDGGRGKDFHTGGSGSDRFIFNSGKAFSREDLGVDEITDMTSLDKILLSRTTFTALKSSLGEGFNNTADFAVVSTGVAAKDSLASIVYNSQSGELYYNQNCAAPGFGNGGLFAGLSGSPNISASNFRVIA